MKIIKTSQYAQMDSIIAAEKNNVNTALEQFGFDGNQLFPSVMEGISKISEYLQQFNLKINSIVDPNDLQGNSGTMSFDLEQINNTNTFVDNIINNAILTVVWNQRNIGAIGIRAYIS